MISAIISWLASLIISIISTTRYVGIFFLMALESACVPIPSEITMPFAGFLAAEGKFDFWLVVLVGSVANLAGSIVAYYVGLYGGRPLIEKYGKYILFSRRDLEIADKWFDRHGEGTVFFSRLLPIIRTFISLPAGIARMNFWKFSLYTFIGSLPWSYTLALIGLRLGENWREIRVYFEKFEILIVAVAVVAVIWWIKRHIATST